VRPGYHLSKKHWNTVVLDNTIPNHVILGMIDDSYSLVVKGLKKSVRKKLEHLEQGGNHK
jgi:predicted DNA-binding protein (MmcQ/YjbR family)